MQAPPRVSAPANPEPLSPAAAAAVTAFGGGGGGGLGRVEVMLQRRAKAPALPADTVCAAACEPALAEYLARLHTAAIPPSPPAGPADAGPPPAAGKAAADAGASGGGSGSPADAAATAAAAPGGSDAAGGAAAPATAGGGAVKQEGAAAAAAAAGRRVELDPMAAALGRCLDDPGLLFGCAPLALCLATPCLTPCLIHVLAPRRSSLAGHLGAGEVPHS
jgi:hypothetical protein